MRTAERLQRLILLSSLLLGIAAVPLLLVNAWAALAILVLAGLGVGSVIVMRAQPAKVTHDPTEVEAFALPESQVAPTAAGEAAQTQHIRAEASDSLAEDEHPAADHVTAQQSAASRQRSLITWLWLGGALLIGAVIGALVNRILPMPNAELAGASDIVSAEPISPLISPIRKPIATSDLVESRVVVAGEELTVLHSMLDIGQAADIFDARPETLMRGASANPFIFEVRYPQPKLAGRVVLHLARMSDFEITINAVTADGETLTFGRAYAEELIDPVLEFEVPGGARPVQAVRVAILDRRPPPQEGFHTHVREFALR
ncbi:MAG: hypothetical protein RMN52_03530 [Anaerolineae bacterium]|nr:hypothetical protein [Candidatus Roseilinea sp.]MDW8449052.1 hypothetical protein [Anaerolineae bacterium]